MTTYWCEYAWLGGQRADRQVSIEVDDGVIGSVKSDVSPDPNDITLMGLTLPGFANSHSHAFHRALRAQTQKGQGSFWIWRDRMYGLSDRLTPDTYFELAKATYGEMASTGITTVGEFNYLHHQPNGEPYNNPNAMTECLFSAAEAVGIRITVLDTCYLSAGFGEQPTESQRRFSDGSAEAWRSRVERFTVPPGAQMGAAIHSVRAVDPSSAAVVATFANESRAPLHAHVSEQVRENTECHDTLGKTPIEVLEDSGALDGNFTAIHGTHLTTDDIGTLGSSENTVCFCPTTERDLGDGIGPSEALRNAGVSLSVGTDSNAMIDMFEETRAVELNHRLLSGTRGTHDAAALLRASTVNGQRCLGWPDIGDIAKGKAADLTTISLDSVRLAGTSDDDLLEAAVFAATASDVDHVMVGGNVIVRSGKLDAFDVSEAMNSALGAL